MKAYNEKVEFSSLPVLHNIRRSETLLNDVFAHPHWHDEVEILYFVSGFARQQIDQNIFIAKPHDIVIIWGNQTHSTYRHGVSPCAIRVYQFAHHELWESETINSIGFTSPVGDTHPLWKDIYEIIESISDEMSNKSEGFEYQINAYIYQFLSLIIRNREKLPVSIKSIKSHKHTMETFFEFIDENYPRPITLTMAADAVYLSPAQFMRVIKSATGMTFKTYLDHYRIEKAIKILLQGLTVSEAAEKSGFQNVNTFIRVFKQIKNCTPSCYKAK